MKLYNQLIIHLYVNHLIFDKFDDFTNEFRIYSVKIVKNIYLNK